jgi:hypothetical protein
MPHPAHPALPQQFSGLAIPETCPPGEGMVWLHPLRECTVPGNDDHMCASA